MTGAAEGNWSGERTSPSSPTGISEQISLCLYSIQCYHLAFLLFANLMDIKQNHVALILMARVMFTDLFGEFFLCGGGYVYFLVLAHGAAFRLCWRTGAQGPGLYVVFLFLKNIQSMSPTVQ